MLAKKELREKLLMRRASINQGELERKAAAASDFLVNSPVWRNASMIAVFVSRPGEFPTKSIIEAAWRAGKKVSVPKVAGKRRMIFCQIQNWDDLKPGIWGIMEPDEKDEVLLDDSHLVLAPGLAFDRHGWRLGYGGGFYDAYLSRHGAKPLAIGLCHAWQVLPAVPHDINDYPLDGLCNENGLIWCHK